MLVFTTVFEAGLTATFYPSLMSHIATAHAIRL